MTLFLRDKGNNTIVDIELYEKEGRIEISATVSILRYTVKLLELYKSNSKDKREKAYSFARTIDNLSEIRGWFYEVYLMHKENTVEEFDNVLKEVRGFLKEVATEFDLCWVED